MQALMFVHKKPVKPLARRRMGRVKKSHFSLLLAQPFQIVAASNLRLRLTFLSFSLSPSLFLLHRNEMFRTTKVTRLSESSVWWYEIQAVVYMKSLPVAGLYQPISHETHQADERVPE